MLPRQTTKTKTRLRHAGMLGKYVTYAVTVSASTDARLPRGTTVRRRFSDFVLMDSLLKARSPSVLL